jgi:hypothetical protein
MSAFSDMFGVAFASGTVILPMVDSLDSSGYNSEPDSQATTIPYIFAQPAPAPPPPFSVFVRAPNSDTRVLSVSWQTTFREIADRYSDLRKWWGSRLMVSANGAIMEQDRTLWNYNMGRDSEFDIVVVMKGGVPSNLDNSQDSFDDDMLAALQLDLLPPGVPIAEVAAPLVAAADGAARTSLKRVLRLTAGIATKSLNKVSTRLPKAPK